MVHQCFGEWLCSWASARVCVYVCVSICSGPPETPRSAEGTTPLLAPVAHSAHRREAKRVFCKPAAERKDLDTGGLGVSAGFLWTVGAAYL